MVFVDDVIGLDVVGIGHALSNHKAFPNRANIGFCQIVNEGFIRLRVFERGASETQACGSGASAAVAVGRQINKLNSKVKVSLPGGKRGWNGLATKDRSNSLAIRPSFTPDNWISREPKTMSIEKFTGSTKATPPSDQSVLDFLRQSPDFFLRHPSALSELSLPHESGEAVSLIERQIDILRERNVTMRKRMNELLQAARMNDEILRKPGRLILPYWRSTAGRS